MNKRKSIAVVVVLLVFVVWILGCQSKSAGKGDKPKLAARSGAKDKNDPKPESSKKPNAPPKASDKQEALKILEQAMGLSKGEKLHWDGIVLVMNKIDANRALQLAEQHPISPPVFAALAQTAPSDKLLQLAQKIKKTDDRDSAVAAIAAGLLAKNPEKALEIAKKITSRDSRQEIISNAVYAVSKKDFAKGLKLAQGMESGAYLPSVMQAAAEKGDEQALQKLSTSITNEQLRFQAKITLIGVVARKDPDRAVTMLKEATDDPKVRDELMASLAASLGSLNPQKSLELLEQVEDEQLKERALFVAIQNIAAKDSNLALAKARQFPQPDGRAALLTDVAATIAKKKPKEAAKLLQEALSLPSEIKESDLKKQARGTIAAQLVTVDAKAGAVALAKAYGGKLPKDTVLVIAATLGQQSSKRAMQFVDSLGQSVDSQTLIQARCLAVATNDPEKAMALAGKIKDTESRNSIYLVILHRVASKRPKFALQGIKKYGELKGYPDRQSYIAAQAAERDSEAGLEIAKNISDPYYRSGALASIAGRKVGLPPELVLPPPQRAQTAPAQKQK